MGIMRKGSLLLLLFGLYGCDTSDIALSKDLPNPKVSISSNEKAITSSKTIAVVVTFNKDVSGFDESDIILTGASIQDFSGSGSTYTFTLVIYSSNISVQILSGAAISDAGDESLASNIESFVYKSTDSTANTNSASCFDTDLYLNKNSTFDL